MIYFLQKNRDLQQIWWNVNIFQLGWWCVRDYYIIFCTNFLYFNVQVKCLLQEQNNLFLFKSTWLSVIYLKMDTPILSEYFDELWQLYIPLCHLITILSQICVSSSTSTFLEKNPPFRFFIMHRLVLSFVQFPLCLVSLRNAFEKISCCTYW